MSWQQRFKTRAQKPPYEQICEQVGLPIITAEEELTIAIPDDKKSDIAIPDETKAIQPAVSEEDLFFGGDTDDTTAVDTINELIHSDKDMGIKAIIHDPSTLTAIAITADYARHCLGKDSMTAKFFDSFLMNTYIHSCGNKGTRAEQAFDALKAQMLFNGLDPNQEQTTGKKLLGKK